MKKKVVIAGVVVAAIAVVAGLSACNRGKQTEEETLITGCKCGKSKDRKH